MSTPTTSRPTPATTAPKGGPTAPTVTTPAPQATPAAPANADLDAEFIGSGLVMLAPELATATAPKNQRNERQQKMDDNVKRLHELWIKADRPNTWEKMVAAGTVATYFTEPDKSAALKKLVTSAVSLHDVAVRWGTPFTVNADHVKRFNLPETYLGREAISFAIKDKRERAANGKTDK